MPKGVEHRLRLAPLLGLVVPNSVMPKGVEHEVSAELMNLDHLVPNSVMPKGVEHMELPLAPCAVEQVPNSVMPKGVEHIDPSRLKQEIQSAEFSDAERR